MAAAVRVVVPELLDNLAPSDPNAARSRRDLRRIHRVMRSVSILRHAIERLELAVAPRRILELGAGDGTLMLRVAQALQPSWPEVALTLLDRHDLLNAETRAGFESLGWTVTVLRQDALDWAVAGTSTPFDLCMTTLFLHHFPADPLALLMRAVASNAHAFVACEPRRSALASVGSGLVGLLGANRVTREDAVSSVRAGFSQRELTALWPSGGANWSCQEYQALPFSHCFTAIRNRVGQP